MVVLNRIYTRTGDDGTTALGTGARVPKHSQRIAAYGSVDETNAAIGLARQHLGGSAGQATAAPTGINAALDAMLARIQNDLFDVGADLCAPEEPGTSQASRRERLRVTDAQVERLEREIDGMNAQLAPLRSFVLPGGSAAAAALHVARTVCRRAEREIVASPNCRASTSARRCSSTSTGSLTCCSLQVAPSTIWERAMSCGCRVETASVPYLDRGGH